MLKEAGAFGGGGGGGRGGRGGVSAHQEVIQSVIKKKWSNLMCTD